MLFKLLFVEGDWCIFNVAILMDLWIFFYYLIRDSKKKLTANLLVWEEHAQYLFQIPLFSNVLSHLLFWLFLLVLIAVDISFAYSELFSVLIKLNIYCEGKKNNDCLSKVRKFYLHQPKLYIEPQQSRTKVSIFDSVVAGKV